MNEDNDSLFDEEFIDVEEIAGTFTDTQILLTDRLGRHLLSSDGYLDIKESSIKLDPEQVIALKGVHAQLKARNKSLYIQAPTGWGKTVTILKLFEILMNNSGGKLPRIFIAVPDVEALDNWRAAFDDMLPVLAAAGLDNPLHHVGYYYSDQKDTDKAITVGTIQSLMISNDAGIFGDHDFDVMVVDEGHTALSELRDSLLGKSSAVRIYLSATPAYTRAKSLDNIAVCAYACPPDKAEALKLVAPYENIVIAQPDITLDAEVMNTAGEFDGAKLARRGKEVGINQTLLHFYLNQAQPHNRQPFFGTQGIVNCFNVQDAIETAAEINKALEGRLPRGVIGAVALHGNTSRDERRRAKQLYREGKILILAGRNLLTHSFHDPRTIWVFNKVPSASGVQVGQRGGRARSLSRDPDAPFKMSYIIDVLYRNVKLGSWQILYGEYMKGTLLDDTKVKRPPGLETPPLPPMSEDESKKKGRPWGTLELDLLKAGTILSDRNLVEQLYIERARLLAKLRPAPMWSKNFPTLWAVAKKQEYFSTRMLADGLAANGETGFTVGKLQNVLSGHVAFYDTDVLEWHPLCLALSRLLKRHVADLFPLQGLELPDKPNPNALRRRANRERFLAVIQEEGYESFADFSRRTGIASQRVHTIASEGTQNFSSQGWFADAMRIAELLGKSPEATFGTPDEIAAIHEEIRTYAEAQGTVPGRPLDPFFAVPIFDAESELNYTQTMEAFTSAMASMVSGGVLGEREWKVLQMRHGLWQPFVDMTLDEVGAELKVTRERIRQIEAKAMRKLKHPARGLHRLYHSLTT